MRKKLSSEERISLIEIGKNLFYGQSSAGNVCPFCWGGDNHDKSFSVTRKMDGCLVYLCHRLKCKEAGILEDYTDPTLYPKRATPPEAFSESTRLLSDEQLSWFESTYGLIGEELGRAKFLYLPERKAVWQPVISPFGGRRGGVIRSYNEKKVRNVKEMVDEPWISWYWCDDPIRDTLVVCEDQLSAIKCARYFPSVALLGIDMSPEKVTEIAAMENVWKFGSVHLILDPDAFKKAMEMFERWCVLLPGLMAVKTDKDPKYWDDEQIKGIGG
jgi:hypothetical protein